MVEVLLPDSAKQGQRRGRVDGRAGDRGGNARAVRYRNDGQQARDASATVVIDRGLCRLVHDGWRQAVRVALDDGDACFKWIPEQPRGVGVRVRGGRPGRDQV